MSNVIDNAAPIVDNAPESNAAPESVKKVRKPRTPKVAAPAALTDDALTSLAAQVDSVTTDAPAESDDNAAPAESAPIVDNAAPESTDAPAALDAPADAPAESNAAPESDNAAPADAPNAPDANAAPADGTNLSAAECAKRRAAALTARSKEVAKSEDNPGLTKERAKIGRSIINDATFERTHWSADWNGNSLGNLTGRIDDGAAQYMDKDVAKSKSDNYVRLAFFGGLCDAAGLTSWVDVSAARLINSIIPATMDQDNKALSATFKVGAVDFLRVAIPANVRGKGQWTKDTLKSKIEEHKALMAQPTRGTGTTVASENAATEVAAQTEAAALSLAGSALTTVANAATNAAPNAPAESAPAATDNAATNAAPAAPESTNAPESAPAAPESAPAASPMVPAALNPANMTPDQIIALVRSLRDSGNMTAILTAQREINSIVAEYKAQLAAQLAALAAPAESDDNAALANAA